MTVSPGRVGALKRTLSLPVASPGLAERRVHHLADEREHEHAVRDRAAERRARAKASSMWMGLWSPDASA